MNQHQTNKQTSVHHQKFYRVRKWIRKFVKWWEWRKHFHTHRSQWVSPGGPMRCWMPHCLHQNLPLSLALPNPSLSLLSPPPLEVSLIPPHPPHLIPNPKGGRKAVFHMWIFLHGRSGAFSLVRVHHQKKPPALHDPEHFSIELAMHVYWA